MTRKKTTSIAGPLIVKGNELVEASYRLTLQEQRLILYMASLIRPDETEFKLYRITIAELARVLGVAATNIYTEAQAITKELIGKKLTIKNRGEKTTLHATWLASAKYYEGEGVVELEFSQQLKPYLLQLQERFTALQRQHVIRMTSTYAIRIYMLLKQYQTIGWRRFDLEELRQILGIRSDEYPLYGHFKSRVLLPAQKELSKHGDISFRLEEHKTIRKVTALTLHIEANAPAALAVNVLAHRLQQFFLLTSDQAQEILQNYEQDVITKALDYTEHQLQAGKVDNLPAFTLAAIRNGWQMQQSLFEMGKQEKEEAARLQAEEEKRREASVSEYQNWFRGEVERIITTYPADRLADLTSQARERVINEHGDGPAVNIMTRLLLAKIIAEQHNIPDQEEWEKGRGKN